MVRPTVPLPNIPIFMVMGRWSADEVSAIKTPNAGVASIQMLIPSMVPGPTHAPCEDAPEKSSTSTPDTCGTGLTSAIGRGHEMGSAGPEAKFTPASERTRSVAQGGALGVRFTAQAGGTAKRMPAKEIQRQDFGTGAEEPGVSATARGENVSVCRTRVGEGPLTLSSMPRAGTT